MGEKDRISRRERTGGDGITREEFFIAFSYFIWHFIMDFLYVHIVCWVYSCYYHIFYSNHLVSPFSLPSYFSSLMLDTHTHAHTRKINERKHIWLRGLVHAVQLSLVIPIFSQHIFFLLCGWKKIPLFICSISFSHCFPLGNLL